MGRGGSFGKGADGMVASRPSNGLTLVLGKPIPLALLSAFLLILAQPPFRILILPFTALVPLAVALGIPAGAAEFKGRGGGMRAAWSGAAFGGLYWGFLLVWVPLVVAPRFPWAYPGYLVQVGLLSGLAALMGWAVYALQRRARVPLFLAFPLAWVAMEFLKARFPMGLAFPWLGLGISLTSWPDLLGLAEWTGEAGVAFWLALVNGLLASALLGLRGGAGKKGAPSTPFRLLGLAAVMALAPALLGVFRGRTLPLTPGPRVGVVGTTVPAALRLQPVEGTRAAMAQVQASLMGVGPGELDLVVLPEATLSVPLEGARARGFRDTLSALARRLDAHLVVGALGAGGGDGDEAWVSNAAYLLAPDGTLAGRYDKVRLVPGMEWGMYRRGSSGRRLAAGDAVVAPLICYESLFGGLARTQAQGGATLLVNLTSDVWFGGRGVGQIFLAQHPAHLVMRAVENRLGVARAANGGISLILDPRGRPATRVIQPDQGGLALATVPVMEGGTLFNATGDLVGPLSFLGLILLILIPRAPWAGRPLSIEEGLRNPSA